MNESVQKQVASEVDSLVASGELEFIPNDDKPVVINADLPSSEPKENANKEKATQEEEGAAYWKAEFEAANKRYKDLSQYEGIIKRLETDSELVDVLERKMAGEIVDGGNADYFNLDEDQTTPKGTPRGYGADEISEAEKRGAQMAQVQQQIQNQLTYLMENGVPDHVTDKFMKFVNNPSGVTMEHLWQVFQMIEGVEEPSVPADQGTKKPGGGSISSMPGSSDRPDNGRYVPAEQDGASYHGDPNNL